MGFIENCEEELKVKFKNTIMHRPHKKTNTICANIDISTDFNLCHLKKLFQRKEVFYEK